MAGGHDGASVLHAGADDLGDVSATPGEMQLEFVGPCAGGHAHRGHASFVSRVRSRHADRFYRRVFGAVHDALFGARIPVVSDDAMHGRCGACGDARVAWPRVGRGITEMVVHRRESVIEKAEKPAISEALRVAMQVVCAHLVHRDADDQSRGLALAVDGLWFLCHGLKRSRTNRGKQEGPKLA